VKSRIQMAKPEHEVAYQDLIQLMRKHAGKLTSLEMLAVAANMVGKLVAMQDQRITTSEVAMETVIQNLQAGNQEVLESLSKSAGQA
jgi:hypothetical protein